MRSVLQLGSLVVVAAVLLAFGGKREAFEPAPDDSSADGRASGADADRAPGEGDRLSEPDDVGEADLGADGSDGADDAEGEDDPAADEAPLVDGPDGGKHRPRGGCPSTMVRAGELLHRPVEAPDRRGGRPLVMQSANDANGWCQDHHKRLCTEDEWISACQGEQRRAYPYGNEHVDGRCNDDKEWQKVDEALLAKWPAPEAKATRRSSTRRRRAARNASACPRRAPAT